MVAVPACSSASASCSRICKQCRRCLGRTHRHLHARHPGSGQRVERVEGSEVTAVVAGEDDRSTARGQASGRGSLVRRDRRAQLDGHPSWCQLQAGLSRPALSCRLAPTFAIWCSPPVQHHRGRLGLHEHVSWGLRAGTGGHLGDCFGPVLERRIEPHDAAGHALEAVGTDELHPVTCPGEMLGQKSSRTARDHTCHPNCTSEPAQHARHAGQRTSGSGIGDDRRQRAVEIRQHRCRGGVGQHRSLHDVRRHGDGVG